MKGVYVALSGGGVRGAAHVGVLRVLEEEQIPVRMIAGTSAGALVGAAYAAGKTLEAINVFISDKSLFHWRDISLSRQGFVHADHLMDQFMEFIGVSTFEELRLPLLVNAFDVQSGEDVLFSSGPLRPALRASMAIPGVVTPVQLDGRVLVDGGVINPVPLRFLPTRLPVVISDVAWNVAPLSKRPSVLDIWLHVIRGAHKKIAIDEFRRAPHKCVHVTPDLKEWTFLSFKNKNGLVEAGDVAMRAALPKLRQLLR